MSYDLAVWLPSRQMSNKEAGKLYGDLCDSNVAAAQKLLIADARLEAFYRELTAKHPEIDDVPADRLDDHDFCPWSVAFDRSDRHIIMCCVWERAEYVHDFVSQLAAKHNLVAFDPQSGAQLGSAPPGGGRRQWWRFW